MSEQVSISVDVGDLARGVEFYTQALGCEAKKKYTDEWQVVSRGGLDIHLQQKTEGTEAAAQHRRSYHRHWTPVHLDFGVTDVRLVARAVEQHGGLVESQSFSDVADIAVCADPFGNGFCLIRE